MEEISGHLRAKGIAGGDSLSPASGARKLKEMRGKESPRGVEMKPFAKEKPRAPARSGPSIQACPMGEHGHEGVQRCVKDCVSCANKVSCSKHPWKYEL